MARHTWVKAGYPFELAEDFSQFCLMKIVCEKRKASLKDLLIDFVRSEFGSFRSENGRLKSRSRHYKAPSYHEMKAQYERPYDKSNEEKCPDVSFLKPQHQHIVQSMYLGFTLTEIADVMDCHPANISQKMYSIRQSFLKYWEWQSERHKNKYEKLADSKKTGRPKKPAPKERNCDE